MKHLTLLGVILISSLSTAQTREGSVSGGGDLPAAIQPEENYRYVCNLRLAQQANRANGREVCYETFEATVEAVKQPDDFFGRAMSLSLDKIPFKKTSNANCGTGKPLPKQTNTFVSLSVTLNQNSSHQQFNQFVTSLFVRVAAPGNALYMSESHSNGLFSNESVEANTFLATPRATFSFTAACVRPISFQP